MPGTAVKARRVTEPTLVQRHPYQLDDNEPLSELASAWNNITEAKTALYRAEARLEHSEDARATKDQRTAGAASQLKSRHPTNAPLPVDSVPSMEIRSNQSSKATFGQKRMSQPTERPRKRVTIKEDQRQSKRPDLHTSDLTSSAIPSQRDNATILSNITKNMTSHGTMDSLLNPSRGASATALSDLPGTSSSLDILGNGPANLSADSSSEIRVLNDNLAPTLVRQSSTVEVSPGLRVSKDYIPAYDRLFGDKPVLKPSERDSVGVNLANTPENRRLLSLISSSQKPRDPSMLGHMEKLRERIQQQKMSASREQDQSIENHRRHHQESDPVMINSEADRTYLFGANIAPKVPVRKVASAPAAPVYRGFNQAETRFQVPDGRIVTEDQLKRKTSRQSVRTREQAPVHNHLRTSNANAVGKPLQPSHRQMHDNHGNSRALINGAQQKPVRKVRKAALPSTKPKKPETAISISASAWREGQKTVLKVLGPPPNLAAKQPSHLPPVNDTVSDNTRDSHVNPEAAGPKSEDEAEELSEHPIESDHESDAHLRDGQQGDVAHLPEEAQGILIDLHLGESDDERESPPSPSGSKSSKVNNNVPQMSRKKKVSRSKSKDGSATSAPVQKVRHYAAEDVQQYMAKQRADRRKRMQEEKRQKALQAEKKKEQLQDLYKRQRESAKTAPPKGGMPGTAPAPQDQVAFDQTFSKGPGSSQPQLNRPISLQRQHPFPQNPHRRIDMTGSDKENRAFWSTSSSDSSLRSSPQTDLSASTPVDTTHPGATAGLGDPYHAHQGGLVGGEGGSGRDIVLEPVREEEPPPASAPSMVIRNRLNEEGNKAAPKLERPATRPNIQAKPRGNADRIAAIKATAAALQGRLENEVRQLAGDIAANILSSSPNNQGTGSLKSPSNERWAYPWPGSGAVALAPVTSTPSQVTKPVVRFSMPPPSPQEKMAGKLTKHQKVTGADKDFDVFVGLLPGVTNLNQQARKTTESRAKADAATTIQAAFRGHQVRQKMKWDLPSGTSLADQIQGKKDDAPIPQVRLSTLTRPSPPVNFSNQDGLQSDGESLSEGPLSDESSGAEVDQEYTPKFKSLPTRAQARLHHPPDNRQTNINFGPGHRAYEPHCDGLSVIDIYMKRYQESQKEMQARQLQSRDRSPAHPLSTQKDKSPAPPHSYSEDFTSGGSQSHASSIIPSLQLDSPAYSRNTGPSPILSSASADNISQLTRPSSKDSSISRPPTGRSLSMPSPGKDDTSKSLSVAEKKRSRTPSPRPLSLRDAGTQTPPSSRSSPASVKSRSSGSRGSHSPHSDTRSPVSDHKSPVDEIRSLIEDLKKSTSNVDSLPGDSVRSGILSPASRSSQGQDISRHSPSLRTPVESPTSPQAHLGQHGASSAIPVGGRNAKSPVTREVLNHFKPIARPGSEMSSSRSSSSVLSSAISQPGPKYFSPSALQLKMAAELNLLEILEESVRQVSEVERSRAVALAQQESSSLAKILQARQMDHEKEINLLSLKAKQEVEAANRQFDEMKQRTAETALEVEQIRVAAKKEVAAETRDSAHRLLQTQAEAAKTTAEAAKQLAEAHKASMSKPPLPPPPQVDPGQVASETAKAAASAAVTAALEQQRLHQRDLLQEMRASYQPPPPVTRSVAAGDSRTSSVTPSRSTESKTPSGHYTDDFSNTASASLSHTVTSPSRSPIESPTSSQRIVDGAGDSSASRISESSKSIKTASSISVEHPGYDQNDSIATASDLVLDKDQSRSATVSSIRTDSAARAASTKDSISEEVVSGAKSLSHQYTNSFEDSASDSEHSSSVPSVISPTPTPRRPEGKKDVSSAMRHGISGAASSTPKDNRHDVLNSGLSEKDESLSVVTIEMIQKQLKEEEARSQQQVTLLKLREKVLVDKTNAELEWLEHQKRRQKEKGDQEGVASLRKRQRALLSKLQSEQAEIKRLLSAQKQSTFERQRLLRQQQEIARLRQVAVRYKDQMRDLPNISPSTSSINADADDADDDDDDVDNLLGSSLDSFSDVSPMPAGAALPVSPMDASALEKQAKVMQKLKMMQQPLSMKLLMKREMKLKKRRKNAEELLAWKQRLDEEEKRVVSMEHEVLTLWEGPKGKAKVATSPPKGERTKGEMKGREGDGYSSASSSLPPHHDAMSYGTHSDEYSYKSDSFKSDIPSISSRTKSESHQSSIKSPPSDRRPGSSSSASVAEEIESKKNSSISEDIASSEKSPTAKGVSETPHAVSEISSDDTIKEASGLQGYGSDSFDSTADQTLTPSKPGTQTATAGSVGGRSPIAMTSPQALASVGPTSSTPKSVSSGTPSSRRSPFVPRGRTRHPSDSGSESEKSFSQTMSETASDQSDVEGRVRALKDALKRRKMEADRLRKQQKRMNREKLKAQEASLKKQLETYDSIIETTKAELDQEAQKQKAPGSGQQLLLTPSAKPQIKQPKAGSDSLRHARALRQRTASDSSQDGGLSESRSIASTRGRSGSESGRSSRSSLEGVGEEKAIGHVPSVGSRDVSYSSFSTTSSPGTRHSEGGVSPKSPHSISRERSRSASSSIAEDISIRSDYSDKESIHDSEKFDSEDHRKIKEKLHRENLVDTSEKEEDRVSISPIVGRRKSGDGKDADEMSPTSGQVGVNVSPVISGKEPSQLVEKDDEVVDKDISISSSVPEDIISAASTQSRDSFEESKSAAALIATSPKSEHRPSLGDKEIESSVSSLHSPARSPAADRRSVTPDEASQLSVKSLSSSVRSQSTSQASSRTQSARSSKSQISRSGDSYSEDTFESSVVSKEKEFSKSDTDEDISEELSEASEVSIAKSSPSQPSGMVVFDLKGKPDDKPEGPLDFRDKPEQVPLDRKDKAEDISFHENKSEGGVSDHEDKQGAMFDLKDKPEEQTSQDELGLSGEVPEVTVTPREIGDIEKHEDDGIEVPKQEEEVLPDFAVGERVLIGGVQPGTLRFKGPTHFASGVWAGVELDEPLGTNDGKIQGIFYFSCKPNFGIFAPGDKVAHLPTTSAQPVAAVEEGDVSEQSLIEEDIPSESSVRMVSDSEPIKSRSLAKEQISKDAEEDEGRLSENSVSLAPSIRSEEVPGGATDDEISEGGIDDDALEKLISNAAEAVESFSHDEPGLVHPVLDTPRGAPEDEIPEVEELPLEDTKEGEREEAEAKMVDSITDHLTEVVVKDTLEAVLEVASKQKQEEEEQKSKESLLQLLVSAESPRSEGEVVEELDEKPEILEKERLESMEKTAERTENKAESLTKSLMNEAISELLKVRKQRNTKIAQANETLRKREEENRTIDEEIRTPDDALSPPELRAETPYTPDRSPERRIDSVSPLDDDIFINRVKIESSFSDNIPVARPGSPVFGESGTVSPEALSEKLQQLQLDKDILEADLFGDEEWFDDEFGSMKKSQSIIKVPERSVSPPKGKAETPVAVSAPEAKVAAKKQAKLDLKKIVEEPFYAVPHNVKELKNLAHKSVTVFHEKVLNEEPSTELAPPVELMGSDTKGSDIESTSRKAYKNMAFALSGEVYHAINREHEPTVQPPWMKPKRKPRRFFFQQPPRDQSELTAAVEDRVLSLTGLVTKPRQETALAGSKLSKKKDHVDEILIDELKEEEPEWIDYDNDELSVKMQLADALFESLLVDTAMVLHQIEDKRKARRNRDES